MKISRLHIDEFAIEDYPTLTQRNLDGDDLLVKGANRSGKTLTLNALLYALYGPRATFGVQPGRSSDIEIGFDSGDRIERGGGRKYRQSGSLYEKQEVDERIPAVLGPEEITRCQFIHSETDKLPLEKLSKGDLVATIRNAVDSGIQEEIDELEEERKALKQELEQIERRDLRPRQRELEEVNLDQLERDLTKIEHLHSLIQSGKIQDIKQRLLDNQEINEELESHYTRRREIVKKLRKVNRQLRNERRYTEEVNSLILDAMDELTCPVCDHVVEEETAKRRLNSGHCPHCARDRDLSELKENLAERVDTADEKIEKLEQEKEDLEEEKEQLEDEIEDLQDSTPDLEELNSVTKLTLREHDYDINAVAEETRERLEQQKKAIAEERSKKEELEAELESIQVERSDLEESLDRVNNRIVELTEESFEEIITQFQEDWSVNFQGIAQDFGMEIHIEEDGEILLPGNEGARDYGELSTGEARLLNLAFAYTIVDTARENDNFDDCFETIVLDEPFANLDEEKRKNAMEFIRDGDVQVIVLSSNEDLSQYFDSQQIKPLPTLQIQLTFEDI